MFDRENTENCSTCHKEFTKESGTGIAPSVPVCDLCPRIDDLEMEAEDALGEIDRTNGPVRSFHVGRLAVIQFRLNALRFERSNRL